MVRLVLLAALAILASSAAQVEARQVPLVPGAVTALSGEGSACRSNVYSGVCTAGPCVGGFKIAGACKGARSVQCCVPNRPVAVGAPLNILPAAVAPTAVTPVARPAVPAVPAVRPAVRPAAPVVPVAPAAPIAPWVPSPDGHVIQVTDVVRAGVKKLPGTELAFPFPYSFPYANGRHIVADFALQRVRLYDGRVMVKEWKISSGKNGIGFTSENPATPAGRFRIYGKIGKGQPLGMIIEKWQPQNRIGAEKDAFAHMQTRLLLLDGLDAKNKNTKNRSIYLHGTNKESLLGTPQSHGCFRMGNEAIIELFDAVEVGTEFFAVPFNAWP